MWCPGFYAAEQECRTVNTLFIQPLILISLCAMFVEDASASRHARARIPRAHLDFQMISPCPTVIRLQSVWLSPFAGSTSLLNRP